MSLQRSVCDSSQTTEGRRVELQENMRAYTPTEQRTTTGRTCRFGPVHSLLIHFLLHFFGHIHSQLYHQHFFVNISLVMVNEAAIQATRTFLTTYIQIM